MKNLYRVKIKVEPTPEHPSFWEIEAGYLKVWLYAESAQDATDSAVEVVRNLPYEMTGDHQLVKDDFSGDTDAQEIHARYVASKIGIAFLFEAWEPGEGEIITHGSIPSKSETEF